MLLEAGADVNARTRHEEYYCNKKTPLYITIEEGNLSKNRDKFENYMALAKLLLQHGANVNTTPWAPLHEALSPIIECLGIYGENDPNLDFVRLLLQHNADPNLLGKDAREGEGNSISPLNATVQNLLNDEDNDAEADTRRCKKKICIQLLLEHGAIVEEGILEKVQKKVKQWESQHNPLATHGAEVCDLLMKYGAAHDTKGKKVKKGKKPGRNINTIIKNRRGE